MFTAYQTVGQSVVNATFVALGFDTNESDTYSGHSTVTNNTRYTGQVAGWYEFNGMVAFASNGAGERRSVWAKNGSQLTASQPQGPASSVSTTGLVVPTRKIFLNVGDYVELLGWQNSGGALNTDSGGTAASYMSAKWIHA